MEQHNFTFGHATSGSFGKEEEDWSSCGGEERNTIISQSGGGGGNEGNVRSVKEDEEKPEGWPLMKKGKEAFHGYDTFFLKDPQFINIAKHNMLICKNGSLAVFDVDSTTSEQIVTQCNRLLECFSHKTPYLPFNEQKKTLFFRMEKCDIFTVHYHGVYKSDPPPVGKVFKGKLSLKLSGVKVKNEEVSPMLKADQLLIPCQKDETKSVECRIPMTEDDY